MISTVTGSSVTGFFSNEKGSLIPPNEVHSTRMSGLENNLSSDLNILTT